MSNGFPKDLDNKQPSNSESTQDSGPASSFFEDTERSQSPGERNTSEISGTKTLLQAASESDTAAATTFIPRTSNSRPIEQPAIASIFFPHLVFANRTTRLECQIHNPGIVPVTDLVLEIISIGLKADVSHRIDRLNAEQTASFSLDLTPARDGIVLLNFVLRYQTPRFVCQYAARHAIGINPPVPRTGDTTHLARIRTNVPSDTARAGDRQPADVPLEHLPGYEVLQQQRDLQAFELPREYRPLPTFLEFHLDRDAYEEAMTAHPLAIPADYVRYHQEGVRLSLIPTGQLAESVRQINLVAAPEFLLGRRRSDADFVTWFMPIEDPENQDRTCHLSKIHTKLSRTRDAFTIADADSSLGTTVDQALAEPPEAFRVGNRAFVVLAKEYFLDIIRQRTAESKGPMIQNLVEWHGPRDSPLMPVEGAVYCRPSGMNAAYQDSIWIFTDASFGSSPFNPIVVSPHPSKGGQPAREPAEVQGRFHYFRGCFWLENRVNNYFVFLNHGALKKSEIAPLMDGQVIQLGEAEYKVKIY